LRERSEDVPPLAEFFLAKFASELNSAVKFISREAIDLLISYGWKGNVRELENSIERATILCDGDTILPGHLSLEPGNFRPAAQSKDQSGSLEEVSRRAARIAESARIRKALQETRGNKTKAAALLQVSYKTLLTKIKDYKL
jgi:two-component system response regulator AtoC